MLQSLHIENYALIPKLAIEFGPGLNALTGETGSGKSIVVDALGLLLGGKASAEVIRAGADRAVISGGFQVTRTRALATLGDELGVELDSDELLIKREVQAGGKSRAFVNDRPATVATLRALAAHLAEIHGQNEQTELFSPAVQLALLDRAAGVAELADNTAQRFSAWRAAQQRLESFQRDEQDKLRLLDLWTFQKREIAAAQIRPGEDTELEAEKRVLANAGRIHAALDSAYQALYDAPGAAAPSVASALKALEDAARFDAALDAVCGDLRSARIAIEEAAFTVRARLDRLNADPQRLEAIEERLAALDKLKRKYGRTLEDVLAHLDQVAQQLDELESSEELAKAAAQDLAAAAAAYEDAVAALSARRKDAARRLEKAVQRTLGELAMEGSRFRVEFQTAGEWRATGTDVVDYLVSPNPGEPMHPLRETASGGELSRLMMALKLAAGGRGLSGTLVFDEVDAGIGGRVAETVGRKLKTLAGASQILCVTHLPQIAAFADHHYFVEKYGEGGRTVTSVRALAERERPAELARMLSGSKITDAGLAHAGEMLKAAK